MGQYTAKATNSQIFNLFDINGKLGELGYQHWYSFHAEIRMSDGRKYMLEPKGFWDAKVELKDGTRTLLEFKMGWKGIVIKSLFNGIEDNYLLKYKGLLSNKFVLLDTNNQELLVAETSFKWTKLSFDYNIETTQAFDNLDNKELFLLTTIHCINYFLKMAAA
ncbi:MAG: hypothetical protein EOO08_10940 [Chitinophagaceae bacterium]|nr:MAG: hypothetical protein EOO08_10940 [Chitinophagaceae bacterium]